jgi:YfiH family protein
MPVSWSLVRRAGQPLAVSGLLESVRGVVHLFSTRAAAGDPDTLATAVGLDPAGLPRLRQVHGNRVVWLEDDRSALGAPEIEEADGAAALAASGARSVPAIRTADCVPVLLAAADGGAIAAVHAGWRGIAAGIVGKAVEQLQRSGVDAGRLVAAIGPAIGACCYEVSPEVVTRVCAGSGADADRITRQTPGARPRLDLREAVRLQLAGAGLDSAAVSVAPWCTSCDEELFFSYRRDGEGAGRMTAMIGWKNPRNPAG